jgi:hypothetical protein
MGKKSDSKEQWKDALTKPLKQRIDEMSKVDRALYYCFVGLLIAVIIVVHIYFIW